MNEKELLSGFSNDDLKVLAKAQEDNPDVPSEELIRQYREFKKTPTPSPKISSQTPQENTVLDTILGGKVPEYKPLVPQSQDPTLVGGMVPNALSDIAQIMRESSPRAIAEGALSLGKSILPGTPESRALGGAITGGISNLVSDPLGATSAAMRLLGKTAHERPVTTSLNILGGRDVLRKTGIVPPAIESVSDVRAIPKESKLGAFVSFETGQSPGELSAIRRVTLEHGEGEKALLEGIKARRIVQETEGRKIENSVQNFTKELHDKKNRTLADYISDNISTTTPSATNPEAENIGILKDALSGTVTPKGFVEGKLMPALQNLHNQASAAYQMFMGMIPLDRDVDIVSLKNKLWKEVFQKGARVRVKADLPGNVKFGDLGGLGEGALSFIKEKESARFGYGDMPAGGKIEAGELSKFRGTGEEKLLQQLYDMIADRADGSAQAVDALKQSIWTLRDKVPDTNRDFRRVLDKAYEITRDHLLEDPVVGEPYGKAQAAWRKQKMLEEAMKTDLGLELGGKRSLESPYKKIMQVVDHPDNDFRTTLLGELEKNMSPGELNRTMKVLHEQDNINDMFKGQSFQDLAQRGNLTSTQANQVAKWASWLMPKDQYNDLIGQFRNQEQLGQAIINQAKGIYTGGWKEKGESIAAVADMLNNPSEDRINQAIINAVKADNPYIAERLAGLNAHTLLGRTYFARRIALGIALGIPAYTANPVLWGAFLTLSPRGVATIIRGGAKAERMITALADSKFPSMVPAFAGVRGTGSFGEGNVLSTTPVSEKDVRSRLGMK